jgi:hypothetical protein
MRKHRLHILLILGAIALAFPKISTVEAYQSMLWTADNSFRGKPTDDIVFRGITTFDGIRTWRRIHFGLPFRATTCDTLPSERGSTQVRIERDAFFLNLATAFAVWLLLFSRLIFGKERHDAARKDAEQDAGDRRPSL